MSKHKHSNITGEYLTSVKEKLDIGFKSYLIDYDINHQHADDFIPIVSATAALMASLFDVLSEHLMDKSIDIPLTALVLSFDKSLFQYLHRFQKLKKLDIKDLQAFRELIDQYLDRCKANFDALILTQEYTRSIK